MSRPWSCDTLVATADSTTDGVALFGKNSDRPAGECQPLRYWPRRNDGGRELQLAYLALPDAQSTYAHLGASPYWCWGHELGLNEHGVAIGNEALFTRDLASRVATHRDGRPPTPGLLGMELVRLGLERAATATEAVTVMTDLLNQYGQWGAGVAGKPIEEAAYDNSYLIADSHEAWVLETAGKRWAARAVRTGTCSISNQATIRTDWDRASDDLVEHAVRNGWWPADGEQAFDFARAYSDPATPLQVSHVRLQRSRELLAAAAARGGVEHEDVVRTLRDHYEGTFLDGPYFTAALPDLLTLCMHDSPAGFTWGNTASSTVMHLPSEAGRLPHMWWAPLTPCTGVYLPVFPAAGVVPEALATPTAFSRAPRPEGVSPAGFHDASYWWHFQRLLDVVKGDANAWSFNERQPIVRSEFDTLEQRWAKELPDVETEAVRLLAEGDDRGRAVLADFTAHCAAEAITTCDALVERFS